MLHGANSVPHGFEDLILSKQIDHEIPGIGRGLDVAAGPAEKLDGGGRLVVRKAEDFLDDLRSGRDTGAGERSFNIVGRGSGEEVAEDSGCRGNIRRIKVGTKPLGLEIVGD